MLTFHQFLNEEFVAPHGQMESKPGYLYHATNQENLHDIHQSGKLRTHRPWHGTDQSAWPDGSTEKRSYWSPKAHVVHQFAPEHGKPVIVRVHQEKSKHPFKPERGTGDTYSNKPLASHHLEALTHNGWERLHKIFGPRQKAEVKESWERPYIGWITPKGKDIKNKTTHDYHEDLLPRSVRPQSTSLNDYSKAFHQGYVRYMHKNGTSTFNHDAVHADPKLYHRALDHIEHHLATQPYHQNAKVHFDLTDHRGTNHSRKHDDVASALDHIRQLKRI